MFKRLIAKFTNLLPRRIAGARIFQPSTRAPVPKSSNVPPDPLARSGDGQSVKKIPGHALLIGCDHGDLEGTDNDVESMATILNNLNGLGTYDFKIKRLTGCNATECNIRKEWEKLSDIAKQGDAAVIYYSGHGGREENPNSHPEEGEPNKFQYLVPHDFADNEGKLKHWKGILDIEISRWLYKITKKTNNVTYILDCCFSSGLGKGPTDQGRSNAVVKFKSTGLGAVMFSEIWKRAKDESMKDIDPVVPFDGPDYQNLEVARIAASAAETPAWQDLRSGKWKGVMTDSLCKVLATFEGRSWLNIMAAVGESIKLDFKDSNPQQPRSAGADNRIPFFLDVDSVTELWANIIYDDEDSVVIQGGSSIGTQEGDIYELRPLPWTHDPEEDFKPFNVKIDEVYGFSAVGTAVSKQNGTRYQASRVAFATLVEREKPRPIEVPSGINDQVKRWINDSKFFKVAEEHEELVVAFEQQDDETITLYGRARYANVGRPGVALGSLCKKDIESDLDKRMTHLFGQAERFARACDVVSLTTGNEEETFELSFSFQIWRYKREGENEGGKKRQIFPTDPQLAETIEIAVKDHIYFVLTKDEKKTNDFWASLLVVDAVGEISILSLAQGERGINLTSALHTRTIGKGPPKFSLKSPNIPGKDLTPADQHFVVLLTEKEVDLRYLQSKQIQYAMEAKAKAMPDKYPQYDVIGRSNAYCSTRVHFSFLRERDGPGGMAP